MAERKPTNKEDAGDQLLGRVRSLPAFRRLPIEGQTYVAAVCREAPSRSVGVTSLMSVSGACVVKRFTYVTEFESAGCEKPFVLAMALDKRVVEVLAQPKQIQIVRKDRRGRRMPCMYTPDFLVFCASQILLVEAKPRSRLEKLASESEDWIFESGTWSYLPAKRVATEFGLGFNVFCPEDLPAAFRANLEILARFGADDPSPCELRLLQSVVKQLRRGPASISDLCHDLPGLTAKVIYWGIKNGQCHGLLRQQMLQPDFVVYGSHEEMESREAHFEEGPAETCGPIYQKLMRATYAEVCAAKDRFERFEKRRAAREPFNATDYRIAHAKRAAEAEGAPQFAAFLPNFSSRGNRTPRISAETRASIVSHAKNHFDKGRPPVLSKLYADYARQASEHGDLVPSHETHRRVLAAALSPEDTARRTGGKRAYHAVRPVVDGGLAVPRVRIAGLRAHIDGVYGDVRAARTGNGEYLRPIFYPLIDDTSGYVFSVGVKIGNGSRLPVLMAHRDCIRRHGFLPSQIIEDWGSEFYNTDIPEMRARLGVGYERRPAGAPRFGGRGESFNSAFSRFLQNLCGGTYFDQAPRASDRNKQSRATAALSICQIVTAAQDWIFKVWNNVPIAGEVQTPAEILAESIACFPEAVVPVRDDINSRYATALSLKSSKFTYKNGFRYAGRRYQSAALPALIRGGEGVYAPRLDCMNASIIHVMTDRGPLELRSLDYHSLAGAPLGTLVEALHSLFNFNTRSQRNQLERNLREAELLTSFDALGGVDFDESIQPTCSLELGAEDIQLQDVFESLRKDGISPLERALLQGGQDD